MRKNIFMIVFTIIFIVIVIMCSILFHKNTPIYQGLRLDGLDTFQQKAADVYSQAVNLLITLATLLLGGIWLIYKSTVERQDKSNPFIFILSIISSAFILVSLYCGFRSHTSLLNQLLEKSFLVVAKSQMLYFFDSQFTTFLLGVCFFVFSFLLLIIRDR